MPPFEKILDPPPFNINILYYSQMEGLLSILVYKARASEIDRGTSTEVQRLQEAVHRVES